MGKNWIISLKKTLPNKIIAYSNFSPLVIRKMAKGGAGWTLFLDVADLLYVRGKEKIRCREAT